VAGGNRSASRPPAKRLRSLKVSDAFKRFVLDQLEELGDVTPRSMFGGVGLYHAGVFFGLLARDTLYLKIDDSSRPDYEAAGMAAFRPYRGRGGTMRYAQVPRLRAPHLRTRLRRVARLRLWHAPMRH